MSIRGYRVVYRVETHAQGTEVTQRQVEVRRPLDSRDVTSPATGGSPTSGFVSVGTRLYQLTGAMVLDDGDRVAAVAPGDYRLRPILADLLRLRLARRVGAERVAGRPCTVYRLGQPLEEPIRPRKAGQYADVCVDGSGIVLAERWFLHGGLLRDTRAEQVDETAPPDTAFVTPPGNVKTNPTAFSTLQTLPLSAVPDTGLPYWTATAPWGFHLARRTRQVTTSMAGDTPQVVDISYVDSYMRGVDVIEVVHREASIAGAGGAGVERMGAGRIGTGAVTLSSSGASIAFDVGKWVVTVSGPVDVAHLRAFSERLRPTAPAHRG